MNIGRVLGWAFSALLFLIPFNWIRLWAVGELPASATLGQSLVVGAVLWAFAGGIAYLLIFLSRREMRIKADDDQAMQALMAQPLTEIRPAQALLKPDEKAYGAVRATLKEVKTVGYSAGTSGVSVRVAKGVTLRTSGTRGKAVKGLVSVANGELVVTNKRVLFAGDAKSFAITLDNLLSATKYTDGFGFSEGGATYTVTVDDDRARVAFGIALDKVLQGQ